MNNAYDLSVVIASYNRPDLTLRLLQQLARQTLPNSQFEVIVVDDGSKDPIAPLLAGHVFAFSLLALAQANAGAAAARHRGVMAATGDVIVFLDDDMQVDRSFLANHLRLHPAPSRRVILGHIRPDPQLNRMPIFERFHAEMLERFTEAVTKGEQKPRGSDVCTGNLSMRRADYLAIGGFDPELKRSEDAELGIRLEESGCELCFSPEAFSLHGSDHTSLEGWRKRAKMYGAYDYRIAQKHPAATYANPWRFLLLVNPVSRPLLFGNVVSPRLFSVIAELATKATLVADEQGAKRLAVSGATLVYGMDYFRGLRDEAGSLRESLRDFTGYLWRHMRQEVPAANMFSAIESDWETIRHYSQKYHHKRLDEGHMPKALVEKVGFQIMAAYRLMRYFKRSDRPLLARLTSRMIRHLYGSDIHWDADFEPGVMLVHGMGSAISHSAKVKRGAILFQNVTIGEGIHPDTREVGAPTIERDVHIGPGATLIGPITIGARSKIMAGALVMRSVPPNSLVEAAAARVSERDNPEKARPRVVHDDEFSTGA